MPRPAPAAPKPPTGARQAGADPQQGPAPVSPNPPAPSPQPAARHTPLTTSGGMGNPSNPMYMSNSGPALPPTPGNPAPTPIPSNYQSPAAQQNPIQQQVNPIQSWLNSLSGGMGAPSNAGITPQQIYSDIQQLIPWLMNMFQGQNQPNQVAQAQPTFRGGYNLRQPAPAPAPVIRRNL